MKTTSIDPIVDEVRSVREEYAARFGYDVGAILRDVRIRQEASGREYVRHPARDATFALEELPAQ